MACSCGATVFPLGTALLQPYVRVVHPTQATSWNPHQAVQHDAGRPSVIEDSLRDLRHGFRMLRRSPGFTAAALLTLALGIGATSAVFSVVRTVMLEPLPYRDPDRIVAVWETNRGGTSRNGSLPPTLSRGASGTHPRALRDGRAGQSP